MARKYVVRSWSMTPYPGVPAPFGGSPPALIDGCSMFVPSPPFGPGGFFGTMALFLVDPLGVEHFTGIVVPYDLTVIPGPDISPFGDSIMVSAFDPLPMPLPVGPLARATWATATVSRPPFACSRSGSYSVVSRGHPGSPGGLVAASTRVGGHSG